MSKKAEIDEAVKQAAKRFQELLEGMTALRPDNLESFDDGEIFDVAEDMLAKFADGIDEEVGKLRVTVKALDPNNADDLNYVEDKLAELNKLISKHVKHFKNSDENIKILGRTRMFEEIQRGQGDIHGIQTSARDLRHNLSEKQSASPRKETSEVVIKEQTKLDALATINHLTANLKSYAVEVNHSTLQKKPNRRSSRFSRLSRRSSRKMSAAAEEKKEVTIPNEVNFGNLSRRVITDVRKAVYNDVTQNQAESALNFAKAFKDAIAESVKEIKVAMDGLPPNIQSRVFDHIEYVQSELKDHIEILESKIGAAAEVGSEGVSSTSKGWVDESVSGARTAKDASDKTTDPEPDTSTPDMR